MNAFDVDMVKRSQSDNNATIWIMMYVERGNERYLK